MQTIIKKSAVITILLAICSTALLAFSPAPGGDKFEIFLNNKLVMEQYISQTTSAKFLTLDQRHYNDKIDVYYSHCGKTGTGRTITLTDGQNKVIKKWGFANATGSNKAMSWKVKEIMDLQKGKDRATLRLVYFSRELPAGRLLASVVTGHSQYASLK